MIEITPDGIATSPLTQEPSRVSDVTLSNIRGPWRTKAGGTLTVPLGLSFEEMRGLMTYNPAEIALTRRGNIRGFRNYLNRGIPAGTIGGTEYHRIRQEFICVLDGAITLDIEDLYGEQRTLVFDQSARVYIPPFILHTYSALFDNTGLLVAANTEFDPTDPLTHDTFSRQHFQELQARYR